MAPNTQAKDIETAWREILVGDPSLVAVTTTCLKYMTPEVEWIMRGGKVWKLDALVGFASEERSKEQEVKLTVTHFVRDGNQVANRHITEFVKPDGSKIMNECMQFMTINESGKIEAVVELAKDFDE